MKNNTNNQNNSNSNNNIRRKKSSSTDPSSLTFAIQSLRDIEMVIELKNDDEIRGIMTYCDEKMNILLSHVSYTPASRVKPNISSTSTSTNNPSDTLPTHTSPSSSSSSSSAPSSLSYEEMMVKGNSIRFIHYPPFINIRQEMSRHIKLLENSRKKAKPKKIVERSKVFLEAAGRREGGGGREKRKLEDIIFEARVSDEEVEEEIMEEEEDEEGER